MALITSTHLIYRWCQECQLRQVHRLYMSGITSVRGLVLTAQCLHCLKAEGKVL